MSNAAAFSGSAASGPTLSQDGFLLPTRDGDGDGFWDAAAQGELRIQACEACGRLRMPPRPMCPWCRSTDKTWRLMSGRGTVWSFAIPHPPLLPAYSAVAPYNVVVVTLDEDPTIRLVGNLVATPESPLNSIDPESIQIGERVEVAFANLISVEGGDVAMVRWVRSGS